MKLDIWINTWDIFRCGGCSGALAIELPATNAGKKRVFCVRDCTGLVRKKPGFDVRSDRKNFGCDMPCKTQRRKSLDRSKHARKASVETDR